MKESTISFEKKKKEFSDADLEKLQRIKNIKSEILGGIIPEDIQRRLYQGVLSDDFLLKKEREISEALEKHEKEGEGIEVDEEKHIVRIGKERTPVFEGPKDKLSWALEGEQFREQGKTMVEIYFKRDDGLEVRLGGEARGKIRLESYDRFLPLLEYRLLKKEFKNYGEAVKNGDIEYLNKFKAGHTETEWVLRSLRHLNSLAIKDGEQVLKRDPEFEETPHVIKTLEKMTRLINRQRERKQGVLILEGDAGTGKNKLVDHFAFLTKRALFRFVCSAGKDEQDLKYLLEYDARKGTTRIKSTVVEALQTTGAILEFDEINTLKPEVAKSILNPLFDSDRAVFLGEDRKKVEAAEEVILMGLENPQHYAGVKPLPETIKSRARIMEVTYPPFEKEKKTPDEETQYNMDEALILRQYVPKLKELSREEFQVLWESIVNKKSDSRAIDIVTSEREERIEDVREIVTLANKIREAYRAYREGRSDEPVNFVFSLRESVESAYELSDVALTKEELKKGFTRAKKAVEEVILPKIPLGAERIYLQSLITEI